MRGGFVLLLAVSMCCSASGAGDASYSIARRAYSDGFYDVASQQCEQLLRENPTIEQRQEILLMLGRCNYELNQWSNSLSYLENVRAGDAAPSQYAEAQYWAGRIFEASGDVPKALFSYEAAASVRPLSAFNAVSSLAAARLYLVRGEYTRCRVAASNCLNAAEGVVSPGEPLFLLGQCDLAEGKADRAQQVYLHALKVETNEVLRPFLQCGLALAAWASARTNDAVGRFRRLSQPEFPAAVRAISQFHIAMNRLAEGRTNEAAAMLRRVLACKDKAGPTGTEITFFSADGFPYADALYHLGQLAYARGNAAAARGWYKRCADEYPNSLVRETAELGWAVCAYTRGELSAATQQLRRLTCSASPEVRTAGFMQLGDIARSVSNLPEALACYTAAANIASNLPGGLEARFRLAVTCYELRDPGPALKELDAVLGEAIDLPLREDASYWRAWCLLQQGMTDEAANDFRAYVNAFPEGRHTRAALLQLGRLAYQKGEYDKAVRLFSCVATNRGDRACAEAAAYELGWVFARQGKKDDAIAQFSRFVTEHPDSELSDDVRYYLGETYFNMSDYTRAYSAFLRVAEKYPSGEFAAAAVYWSAVSAFRKGDNEACFIVLTSRWSTVAGSPHAAAALLLRGDCYRAGGDMKRAAKEYRHARRMATNSYLGVEADFRLGECALVASNWPRAIALFSSLTTDDLVMNQARAHLALGDTLAASGDARGALSEWLRVIYDYRGQAKLFDQAIERAAHTYISLDEHERADQVYRLRAEVTPAKPEASPSEHAPKSTARHH